MVQTSVDQAITETAVGPLKVTVLQGVLKAAVDRAARIAGHKSVIPITSSILLEAQGTGGLDGRLTLTATDLEQTVQVQVAAKVEGEGAIVAPARLLADFIAALPDDHVALEVDGGRLRVRCARSKGEMRIAAAEEFPAAPRVRPDATVVTVDAQALRKALSRVVIAVAAKDDDRHVIRGVFVQDGADGLVLTATDGFQLATHKLAAEAAGALGGWIIPTPAVQEVLNLLTGESGAVTLTLDRERVTLTARRTVLTCQLIQGSYPNFLPLIPQTHESRATMTVESLLRAVQATALFTGEREKDKSTVRLWSELDGPVVVLNLTAGDDEVGQGHTAVDVEIEGEHLAAIRFKGEQLRLALRAMGTEKVLLDTNGAGRPGLLRPVGDDDYLHVLMPMSIT